MEDCSGILERRKLRGIFLLSSQCRLIIGPHTYSSTAPTFEISLPTIDKIQLHTNSSISLQLHHLEEPKDIAAEATQLEPTARVEEISRIMNHTSTVLSFIIIIAIIIFTVTFRNRIYDLFWKPRTIIHLESIPKDRETSTTNEDVHPS